MSILTAIKTGMDIASHIIADIRTSKNVVYFKRIPHSWKSKYSLIHSNVYVEEYSLIQNKQLVVLSDNVDRVKAYRLMLKLQNSNICNIVKPDCLIVNKRTSELLGYTVKGGLNLGLKRFLYDKSGADIQFKRLFKIEALMNELHRFGISLGTVAKEDFYMNEEGICLINIYKLSCEEDFSVETDYQTFSDICCKCLMDETDIYFEAYKARVSSIYISKKLADLFKAVYNGDVVKNIADDLRVAQGDLKCCNNNHNVWYDSSYLLCPICHPICYQEDCCKDLIHEDTEKYFYWGHNLVHKVFKPHVDISEKKVNIAKLISILPSQLNFFPVYQIYSEKTGEFVGYSIRNKLISHRFSFISMRDRQMNDNHLLKALVQLKSVIDILHSHNIYLGKQNITKDNIYVHDGSNVSFVNESEFNGISIEDDLNAYIELVFEMVKEKDSLLQKMSPRFIEQFEKYTLGENVDVYSTVRSLEGTFENFANGYYSKYCFSPIEVPILFLDDISHELTENKCLDSQPKHYSLYEMDNGNIAKIYNSASPIRLKILERNTSIHKKFMDESISLSPVNLIYSKRIDYLEDKYEFRGYVYKNIHGSSLKYIFENDDLTNKDIIQILLNIPESLLIAGIDISNLKFDKSLNVYIDNLDVEISSNTNVISQCLALLCSIDVRNKWCQVGLGEIYETTFLNHLFFSLDKLRKLHKTLNSFCDVHKIWFTDEYFACPICYPNTKFVCQNDFYPNLITCSDSANLEEKEKLLSYVIENAGKCEFYRNPVSIARLKNDFSFCGYFYEPGNCTQYNKPLNNKAVISMLFDAYEFMKQMHSINLFIKDNHVFEIENFIQNFKDVENWELSDVTRRMATRFKEKDLNNLCKFCVSYLSSHAQIEIWDPKGVYTKAITPNNLEKILKELKAGLDQLCSVHKCWYMNNSICCPACAPDIGNAHVMDISSLTTKFSFGGEANIYEVGKSKVAKIYKRLKDGKDFKVNIRNKMLKIKRLIELFTETGNVISEKLKIIFPEQFVIDKRTRQINGYIMEKAVNIKPMKMLLDKKYVREIGWDNKDILEVLIIVGEALEFLHSKGMYIGDVSGSNIAFCLDKKVYIYDTDSFGFEIDDLNSCVFTPDYLDPLAITGGAHNTSCLSDWYSYAIIVFMSLTMMHPFQGTYSPVAGGQKLSVQERMKRRISVLGNHPIIIPEGNVSSWDWISNELKETLLDIFEGTKRESFLPVLVNQLRILNGELPKEEHIVARKTPKPYKTFVSHVDISECKINCIFEKEGVEIQDENIYKFEDKFFILKKDKQIPVVEGTKKAYVSNHAEFFYCVLPDSIAVLNSNGDLYHRIINVLNSNCIVRDKILYYFTFDRRNLYRLAKANVETIETEFTFATTKYVKAFGVSEDMSSNIVVTTDDDDNELEIYLSGKFVCKANPSNCVYTYFDKVNKQWLVLGDKSILCVVKDSNVKYLGTDWTFSGYTDTVCFCKNAIYYPDDHKIFSMNPFKDKMVIFDNCQIVNKYSRLERSGNGFVIINKDKIYKLLDSK